MLYWEMIDFSFLNNLSKLLNDTQNDHDRDQGEHKNERDREPFLVFVMIPCDQQPGKGQRLYDDLRQIDKMKKCG